MPTVLVVDDSQTDQQLVQSLLDAAPEIELQFASNGKEALEIIKSSPPDLLITDQEMPGMDGMELLAKVSCLLPDLPVVLMTAKENEQRDEQAVDNGARACIPKTALTRLLPGIVDQLLSLCKERKEIGRFLRCISESDTTFVLENNDTSLIASMIEYASGCLANSGIVMEGTEDLLCLALEEALRNAIHHGNLELSSELRDMEDDELFNKLLEDRRQQEPFCYRKVYVRVSMTQDQAKFVIRDEGRGFDPSKLPDPTSPEGLESACGRGVLLMRSLMDEVLFNEQGNEVTLIKNRAEELE